MSSPRSAAVAPKKRPAVPAAPAAGLASHARGLRRLAIGLVTATLLLHGLWAGAGQIIDMDVWWTMSAGRYIVESGTIPDRDVLSYTHAGVEWLNGEWLSQVFYFELHRHGGGIALALFKLLAVVAMFAGIAWIGWRRSGSFLLAVLAASLAAYSCRGLFDIRAELFLFLDTISVLAILEAYRRGATAWILVLLAPIMALWVNLHYSFLFGLGILVLYAGSEIAKSLLRLPAHPMPPARSYRLAAAVAIASLATLLNPYGLRALTEPFTIVGQEAPWRAEIIEWNPPALFVTDEVNPAFFGYLLVLQVIAAVGALLADRRRFDLTDAALVLTTMVMALSARRFVTLFALVSAPFLANNLAILRDRFFPSQRTELSTPRQSLVVGIVAAAAIAFVLAHGVADARRTFAPGLFEGMVLADYFPKGAVEFLRMNPLPARLFHPYTWGGYINFELPDRKMFIDGRAHIVYPWSFYLEAQNVEHGQPGWQQVLDRWDVSLIVWPSGSAEYGMLLALEQFNASASWIQIYDDGHSAVFASVERAQPWLDRFRSFSLAYPDQPGPQLFLVQAYLEAKEFARAREQLQRVVRRFPAMRESTREAEKGYQELAESDGSAEAWFHLGFSREANGNRAAAQEAFGQAIERGGLPDPEAAYARESLARLAAGS